MQAKIHPNTFITTTTCACSAKHLAYSTIDGDKTCDICSQCAPFYTGKDTVIKRGRVEEFERRQKAQKAAMDAAKKIADAKAKKDLIVKKIAVENKKAAKVA